MPDRTFRIAIDVGGTNTDAVILDSSDRVRAKMKSPTTADVGTGIRTAMNSVLQRSGLTTDDITQVMFGTTHCTNAVATRKGLVRTAVIRIGAPATTAIPPLFTWPADLRDRVLSASCILAGGHEFNGDEISALDVKQLRKKAREFKDNVQAVAVTAVFSPVNQSHEEMARDILREELGPAIPITISSEIGSIGLLERENATALNAALTGVARTAVDGFQKAVSELGFKATLYLGQNDGTLMAVEEAIKFPVLTIAVRREERLDEWFRNITFIEAPGETPLVEITNRSMRELGSMALLEGQQDEWLTPAAGLPVFPDLWGRDALTASWQATVFDHGEMAESILSRLGRLQGKQMDPWRDEQPGRIIRAAQRGPLTRLGKTPFDRYYGDFASPFAFILALGQLYAWSGDKRLLGKHWDVARRIIDWARHYGDRDGDGYLEYMTQSKAGPTHQGWRDSENGMVYEDGRQVSPPIASCEIQGYYFAAQQFMAVLSLAMGEVESAQAFWTSAREFKACFNRDFWMDDQDCVALGLDPDKRKIKSVTSNAGQCLATGVVDDEKLPRLVRRLFAADMFSGWGIRTLSSDHPSYNPLGYHLGRVWAVENGTILLGLRRFGFTDESVRLARALYDQALLWRGHRIPECVGGYSRDESVYPGAFPQASVPQTWNLSIFPLLVQCLLGLEGLASLKLLAVDPILPAWLPDVTVRRLRVGDATVSLRFYRDERGDSHYEVLEKAGTLHVVRQPPIDSLSTSVLERLGALVRR